MALVACATPPVWEQPPPPVLDAPVVQPGALHRAELDNGLRILVLEDHRLPRVAFSLTLRHGEANLPVEQAGLLSLTADLLERGAGARDALALASAIDELGATLNTSAGWDSIGIGVTGLSRDETTLLDVLADVALRPRFDPREALRARGERLAAARRREGRPGHAAQLVRRERAVSGAPLRRARRWDTRECQRLRRARRAQPARALLRPERRHGRRGRRRRRAGR